MRVMQTVGNVLVRVGLKKRRPQLTREQAMGARPIRNPSLQWKVNDEGNAVVVLPRRGDWSGKALGWLFMVPAQKPVELDEVGSTVWEHCDADHTVAEIVDVLASKYKLNRREVEVSLTEYLRTLGRRGMVGFVVDKEIAREAGVADQDIIGLEDIATTREQLAEAQQRTAEAAEETRRILEEMGQGAPQAAREAESADEAVQGDSEADGGQ